VAGLKSSVLTAAALSVVVVSDHNPSNTLALVITGSV
jgi:hypothetical protein